MTKEMDDKSDAIPKTDGRRRADLRLHSKWAKMDLNLEALAQQGLGWNVFYLENALVLAAEKEQDSGP